MKFEYLVNGSTIHTVETNNEWDMKTYISNKHIRYVDMVAFRFTDFTPQLLKKVNLQVNSLLSDAVKNVNNNVWYTFSVISHDIITFDFGVGELTEELNFLVKIKSKTEGL